MCECCSHDEVTADTCSVYTRGRTPPCVPVSREPRKEDRTITRELLNSGRSIYRQNDGRTWFRQLWKNNSSTSYKNTSLLFETFPATLNEKEFIFPFNFWTFLSMVRYPATHCVAPAYLLSNHILRKLEYGFVKNILAKAKFFFLLYFKESLWKSLKWKIISILILSRLSSMFTIFTISFFFIEIIALIFFQKHILMEKWVGMLYWIKTNNCYYS